MARQAANGVVAVALAPACAVCNAILDEPLLGCVCGSLRELLGLDSPDHTAAVRSMRRFAASSGRALPKLHRRIVGSIASASYRNV
jgi:hypothetical protein